MSFILHKESRVELISDNRLYTIILTLMNNMFVLLVVLAMILLAAVYRYKRRRLYELASLIPALDTELPIIGVSHTLCGNTTEIMATLQNYSYQSMNNNGIIKGWLNHRLYFLLVNPEDIEVILKNNLEKDDVYQLLRDVIGNGGLFAPVSIWRRRRKILAPAFKPKILEEFIEVFSDQAENLVKKISGYSGNSGFDAWPFVTAYTLDSVCETAMGVKLHAQSDPNNAFVTSLKHVLSITCQRMFRIWLQPQWIFKLIPFYSEYRQCVRELHGFTDEIIRKKRKELKISKHNLTEADKNYDLQNYNRKSFLDLLIALSGNDKSYTEVELREEILTLIMAGTDTSAVAISYILLLLSKYPKIQEKAYKEIFDIFHKSDRHIVKQDLQNLKYLEMVIKESLRLFPPVPFILRKNEVEISLPSGNILPAGCGVVVSIWGAHRDPKYWGPDAEHFDPERFLPERFKLQHLCSYIPFSSGPRNCLGYQYSMMSIKTVVASILRKYKVVGQEELGPIPHIPCKLEIMMKAVDGYQIKLEKRN